MKEGNGDYFSATFAVESQDIALVVPQTYMNESGIAAAKVAEQYNIAPENFLIVFDDFQLPLGALRLRPNGSDGGHNGMASIIYHLQANAIPRLRVGVAGTTLPEHHSHELMAEYVLSPFDTSEEKLFNKLIPHATDACLSWAVNGILKTMNAFNKNFLIDASAS